MSELVMVQVTEFGEVEAEPMEVAVQGATVRLELPDLVIEAPWLELWQALATGQVRRAA